MAVIVFLHRLVLVETLIPCYTVFRFDITYINILQKIFVQLLIHRLFNNRMETVGFVFTVHF